MTDSSGDDIDQDDYRRYYGKYRGKVADNQDMAGLGQLQVIVPGVLPTGGWAMPCVPYAGPGVGFFFLPPVGADVWVEFERGDPQFPIWSGGFWGKTGDVPATPVVAKMQGAVGAEKAKKMAKVQVLATDIFSLTINSADKQEVILTVKAGSDQSSQALTLTLNAEGIAISDNNQTAIKLTADDIQVSAGESSKATVTKQKIVLQQGENTVMIAGDSITLQKNPAEIALSATGLVIKNGVPNINLSSASVSINNGALEVI